MELGSLYRPAFGAGTLLTLLLLMRAGRRFWLFGAERAGIPGDLGASDPGSNGAADDAGSTDAQPRVGSSATRNLAIDIVQCGNVVGLSLIAAAVVEGAVQQRSIAVDAGWVGVFGLAALLLLWAGGHWGVRMVVRSDVPAEIVRGNSAAGVVAAAHRVATAVILSRCIYGTDLTALAISLGFFALAQITLHLFVIGFRALTSYDDAEEIRNENLAAAMSYAGVTIALGLLIARATDGAFTGWASSLAAYGRSLLYALILYPVRQVVVQVLLLHGSWSLRGGELDRAIAPSRDTGAGILEACSYLGTALVLARMG